MLRQMVWLLRKLKRRFFRRTEYNKALFLMLYWIGQKVHSGFFHKLVEKTANELFFGQPNISSDHLWHCFPILFLRQGSPRGSVSKKSTCNAGDKDLIPGSGRSPGEGNGSHSSILAWETPQTEVPGGLHSMGLQELDIMTKPPPAPTPPAFYISPPLGMCSAPHCSPSIQFWLALSAPALVTWPALFCNLSAWGVRLALNWKPHFSS